MKPTPLFFRRSRLVWLMAAVLTVLNATACVARPSGAAGSEGAQNTAAQNSSAPTAGHTLAKENLSYADRVAWHAQLKWPDDCESTFDYPDKSMSGLAFYELSPKRYLVQVTCTLGSYQGTYVFLLLDESASPSTSKLLKFVSYQDSGEPGPNRISKTQSSELTGTPAFDGAAKQLQVVDKFRGVGDCGFQTIYGFAKEQPELILVRGKMDCDGKPSNPKDWKKLTLP